MKILNWNIYQHNRDINKAVRFLKEQKADVICLQEFPKKQLHLLDALQGHIAVCDEVKIHKKRKSRAKLYSVIISRYPIQQKAVVSHRRHYSEAHPKGDRYAYFKADSLYVDIDTYEGNFRIFNAHFRCFTGPHHRLSQFQDVTNHLSEERKNIICGDFNTFGKPLINILLWKLFGYKAWEVSINETKTLARLFEAHGLKNPLRKQVTFLKFPIQLDYILIPQHLNVKYGRAFWRSYGSDHFPLLLEI